MDERSREFSEAFRLMDDYVRRWMASMCTPGMAIALFDREYCQCISTYGYRDLETNAPVTSDTLFEIGSITKTFTAVAVLQAAEAGLLDLHAPVTSCLPWFQVQSTYEPITIHHLLNHSAGLVGIIDQAPDIHSAAWMLRETKLAFPPGEQFLYSDAGYQILVLVLESVIGNHTLKSSNRTSSSHSACRIARQYRCTPSGRDWQKDTIPYMMIARPTVRIYSSKRPGLKYVLAIVGLRLQPGIWQSLPKCYSTGDWDPPGGYCPRVVLSK